MKKKLIKNKKKMIVVIKNQKKLNQKIKKVPRTMTKTRI